MNKIFFLRSSTLSLLLGTSLASAQDLTQDPEKVTALQIGEEDPDEDEPDEDEPGDDEEPDDDEDPDEDEPDDGEEPDEDEPDEDEDPDEDEPDDGEQPDEDESDDAQKPADSSDGVKPKETAEADAKKADPDEASAAEKKERDAQNSKKNVAAAPPRETKADKRARRAEADSAERKHGEARAGEGLFLAGGASEEDTEEAARAALIDAPVQGPSLTPLHISTSTWSRLEIRENYDQLGISEGRTQEGDVVFFRARLGIETNPLPISDTSDVLVKVSPQASGNWGQNGTIGEANVGFFEAYAKFRSRRLDTQIGRISLDYGEGLIIGGLDWNQTGRAFDGIVARYKMDHGYLDVLGMQVGEAFPGGAERFLGGDSYLWGVYSGFGEYVGDDIELDAYFLGLSTVRNDAADDPLSAAPIIEEGATLMTVGARVKHKVGFFDYRFEGGFQFGEAARGFREVGVLTAPPVRAYQIDGELGFSVGSLTRISLGGVYASGDDPTNREVTGWNQLFPTGHAFLGLMDVIGARTNVVSGNIKLKRGITEDLDLRIDGHLFARPQAGGRAQVGTSEMAGVELDTQLVQKLGKYAQVRGLYGLFIPSTNHYASDDLVSYGELQAGVEF